MRIEVHRLDKSRRTDFYRLHSACNDHGWCFYADGEPAAWCQCCPRSKLGHLERRLKLEPDPEAWVMSCFFVAPSFRGRGLARALVEGALADLRARGVKRVEAFPNRGEGLPADEAWAGPEALFASQGFALIREDDRLPGYRLRPTEVGTF